MINIKFRKTKPSSTFKKFPIIYKIWNGSHIKCCIERTYFLNTTTTKQTNGNKYEPLLYIIIIIIIIILYRVVSKYKDVTNVGNDELGFTPLNK